MYLSLLMITISLRNCGPLLKTESRIVAIGIGPFEYQGSTITDSLSKANALTNYFSSIYTSEDATNVPVLEGNPLPDIPPIHIHADGVAQFLLNLKFHKAAGPDNFPSYFLKEVANEIAPALSLIFKLR